MLRNLGRINFRDLSYIEVESERNSFRSRRESLFSKRGYIRETVWSRYKYLHRLYNMVHELREVLHIRAYKVGIVYRPMVVHIWRSALAEYATRIIRLWENVNAAKGLPSRREKALIKISRRGPKIAGAAEKFTAYESRARVYTPSPSYGQKEKTRTLNGLPSS